jgi:hypothetical protein
MGWFKKKPKAGKALCLTDFYHMGKSYRANLDTIDMDDPLFINQPFMFMVLGEDNG